MPNKKQTTGFILSFHSPFLLIGLFLIFGSFLSWIFMAYYFKALENDFTYFWKDNTGVSIVTAASQEESIARLLDGIIMKESERKFWPYAIIIENLLSVRPQAGLSQASVVYETLVEGGATRLLAVFDPWEPIPEIEPVRSLRPYYLEWSSEYNALLAHAGGSPKSLAMIQMNDDLREQNLEALSRDGKYFWRDGSKSAPHNLYTSSEKMNFALRDKGLRDKEASFRAWKFKDEAKLNERGDDDKKLTFNFSYGLTYKVSYQYNREKNVYWRFNADQPHKDRNNDKQIEVKNVVVQLVEQPVLSGGQGRLDIKVAGEGKAWILKDGQIIEGIWKKVSRRERTLFYDKDGQEIEFNRGNTWVHVIPEKQAVTYE